MDSEIQDQITDVDLGDSVSRSNSEQSNLSNKVFDEEYYSQEQSTSEIASELLGRLSEITSGSLDLQKSEPNDCLNSFDESLDSRNDCEDEKSDTQPVPQMFLSVRGREKLGYNGYIYSFEKMSADGTKRFWQCERKSDCAARIHTSAVDNSVIAEKNTHTHSADATLIEVRRIVSMIKRKATTDFHERPSDLKKKIIENAPDAVVSRLPSADALRKVVQNNRRKFYDKKAPPEPLNREEIVIPDEFSRFIISDEVQENFLRYDSALERGSQDPDRILIFGRESNQNWAHLMKYLYLDSSFVVKPTQFEQIVVLMASTSPTGFVFPVFYALLPSKTKETYKNFFNAIKIIFPSIEPDSFSIDYDAAVLEGLKQSYFSHVPNIHGCVFQMMSSIRNHLMESDILAEYTVDQAFAEQVRMVCTLQYLPLTHLNLGIAFLEEKIQPDVAPILDWFIINFVGILRSNGSRGTCRFPPQMWTIYAQSSENGLIYNRINDYAEALHKKITRLLGLGAVASPNLKFWKLVDKFKWIQKEEDEAYSKFSENNLESSKDKINRTPQEKRVKDLLKQYESGRLETCNFITQLSQNITL